MFWALNRVLVYWYHSLEKKPTKVINSSVMRETKRGFPVSEMNALHLAHCSLATIGTLLYPTNINGCSCTLKAHAALYFSAKVKGKRGGGVIEKLILASISQGKGRTAGLQQASKILIVERVLV